MIHSASGVATNNHAEAEPYKVSLRKWLVDEIEDPAVLDLYSGQQVMRDRCYRGLPWRGVDRERLGPDQWVGDNRRVVRAIDLDAYTILDLDAYGEPWELLSIITRRKPLTRRIGLAITTAAKAVRLGRISDISAQATGSKWWPRVGGAKHGSASPVVLLVDIMESWAVGRWGGRIISRRRHYRSCGMDMFYDALVVEPR